MKKEISNLAAVVATGTRIARVTFNRNTDENQVKKLKTDFAELGECLQPLMMMDGDFVVSKGYDIYDWETRNKVAAEQAKNYLVVVDGQHRLAAALGMQDEEWKNLSKLNFFINNSEVELARLIASVNNVSKKWAFDDYARAAVATNPDNEVVKFIDDCVQAGFNGSVIGMILFQDTGKKLSNTKLAKVMAGEDLSKVMAGKNGTEVDFDLDIAKQYVEAVKGSALAKIKTKGKGEAFASRYVFEAVAMVAKKLGWEEAISRLSEMTEQNAQAYKDASSELKAKTLAKILREK